MAINEKVTPADPTVPENYNFEYEYEEEYSDGGSGSYDPGYSIADTRVTVIEDQDFIYDAAVALSPRIGFKQTWDDSTEATALHDAIFSYTRTVTLGDYTIPDFIPEVASIYINDILVATLRHCSLYVKIGGLTSLGGNVDKIQYSIDHLSGDSPVTFEENSMVGLFEDYIVVSFDEALYNEQVSSGAKLTVVIGEIEVTVSDGFKVAVEHVVSDMNG